MSVELSAMQWQNIFSIVQSHPKVRIRQEQQCRRFIRAVLWITRSGSQWRLLPPEYGNWNSVYKRFNRWSELGIWQQLFEQVIDAPDRENLLPDSTIVRAHPCANGGKGGAQQALGRSRGGYSTKIHLLSDGLGNPLTFKLSAAQRHDLSQIKALLEGQCGERVIAHRGYDANWLVEMLQALEMEVVIPPRRNRKVQRDYDSHWYKERHWVECLINKLKWYRRIFSRFDKLARTFLSFICFAATLIWLR